MVPQPAPATDAPRTRRRVIREAEIIGAAQEVFLGKGFERALVSDIAAKVGIVEGNVFRYFSTKRLLLDAVLAHMYAPLLQEMDEGLARLSGFRSKLHFIVQRHIRVYTETPGFARLVLHEVRTLADYPTSVLHDLQLRYTSHLRLAMQEGIEAGEVPGGADYEILRSLVYGGLEHLLWPTLVGQRQVDVAAIAETFSTHIQRSFGVLPDATLDARLKRLEQLLLASAVDIRPTSR